MPRAESMIEIEATPERVFACITDYESYPEFLPDIQRAEVEHRNGNVAQVRFELELMMRISYTLRLVESSPRAVEWTLQGSTMLTENCGAWTLESATSGHTRAVYSLDVDFRGVLPSFVKERLVGEALPQTLARFKTRAEGM